MKKLLKTLMICLLIVPCAFVFAACGGGGEAEIGDNNGSTETYTMVKANEQATEFAAVATAANAQASGDTELSEDEKTAANDMSRNITYVCGSMIAVTAIQDAFNNIYEPLEASAAITNVDITTLLAQRGYAINKSGNTMTITFTNSQNASESFVMTITSTNNKVDINYDSATNSEDTFISVEKNEDDTQFKFNSDNIYFIECVKTETGLAFQSSEKLAENSYEVIQCKIDYTYDEDTETATVSKYFYTTATEDALPTAIFGATLPANFAGSQEA